MASRALRFLTLFCALLASGSCLDRGAQPSQPLSFNHKVHVENGLECEVCHETIRAAALAGRPPLATCLTCHESPLTDSPEEEKIRAAARQGRDLDWVPVTRVRHDVLFSHRRHVGIAGLSCATCHGEAESWTAPPSRPTIAVTMNWCIGCHRQRGASEDCLGCHR